MTRCATPTCANERKPTPNSQYCEFCAHDRALARTRATRKKNNVTKAMGRNCKKCGAPCYEYRSPYCREHAAQFYRERHEITKAYTIATGEPPARPLPKKARGRGKMGSGRALLASGAGIGLGQDAVGKRAGKSKPVTPLDIPYAVTPEQAAAFINELERKCCNVRYWLRRRFHGVETAYFVADDGREFTHCPRCGRAAG